jgi:hypothetical protein
MLVLAAGGVPLCVSLSGLCTLLCLLLAAALFLRAAVEHVEHLPECLCDELLCVLGRLWCIR